MFENLQKPVIIMQKKVMNSVANFMPRNLQFLWFFVNFAVFSLVMVIVLPQKAQGQVYGNTTVTGYKQMRGLVSTGSSPLWTFRTYSTGMNDIFQGQARAIPNRLRKYLKTNLDIPASTAGRLLKPGSLAQRNRAVQQWSLPGGYNRGYGQVGLSNTYSYGRYSSYGGYSGYSGYSGYGRYGGYGNYTTNVSSYGQGYGVRSYNYTSTSRRSATSLGLVGLPRGDANLMPRNYNQLLQLKPALITMARPAKSSSLGTVSAGGAQGLGLRRIYSRKSAFTVNLKKLGTVSNNLNNILSMAIKKAFALRTGYNASGITAGNGLANTASSLNTTYGLVNKTALTRRNYLSGRNSTITLGGRVGYKSILSRNNLMFGNTNRLLNNRSLKLPRY